MNEEQIKAINDAMSFLSVMDEMDIDTEYKASVDLGEALEHVNVPDSVCNHFWSITSLHYNHRLGLI